MDGAGVDIELVRRAQEGDEGAFASLAVALGDRLHNASVRILRDLDLAEDASQQAIVSIWRDLPQLRDLSRFEAWAYRILVRACYAEARRERRWSPKLRVLDRDADPSREDMEAVVRRDQLERGFRRLSVEHRAVVVLHHYLDLTVPEIAETLAIPAATVRSRLYYALRGLRAALDADARLTAGEVAR
jgi:RNA polymerase sigma-70 factor (ECF subfamily)